MTERLVELDGQRLKLTNLEKVLYPETGFTKAEVIDYYARIAPVMLPHIAGRGITLKRFPDGVEGGSFFEKRCASHRPEFVDTIDGPGDRGGAIGYCNLDSIPALAWAGNMAALEIHAPMALGADIESPQLCVFDLDPGEPATIIECARVGLELRDVLAGIGLDCVAKTSGSKGMQLYVPLNSPHTHDHTSEFAHAVARVLEKHRPDDVTSVMAKAQRPGKVFIDWSQNSRHKTTVAAYSLRAKPHPTVSTPVSWDEVSDCADGQPLSFTAPEVLTRVADLGDLFAPCATQVQHLPPT
ncbi:MAG TPA: non-homologous end-joining DNA ligase [Acidimicrobiales bacterium]|nr:non-homologous end-joining DNA ligase [Acidimicrobiales bacterium]